MMMTYVRQTTGNVNLDVNAEPEVGERWMDEWDEPEEPELGDFRKRRDERVGGSEGKKRN